MTHSPYNTQIVARKRGATLVDTAYTEIKRRILTNEFAPNHQITEGQLAELLHMSRTPVHEALIRLEKEHLVENIPRHGMRVLPISAQEMLEIYQILTALESQAVALIAARPAKNRGISSLYKDLDAMDTALARNEPTAWAAADERFHRKLFEYCGNGKLAQAGLAFREQVDRARMLTLSLRQTPMKSNHAHRELVGLLKRGDVVAAFDAHRAHRIRVNAELTDIIQQFHWAGF